jgi:hypothetical protein
MTSKTHYPPIIGDGEDTIPVKKTYGVNPDYNSTDLTPTQAGSGLFMWKDYKELVYCDTAEFISLNNIKLIDFMGMILVPSLAAANAATYSQSGNVISVDNGTAHNIPATVYNGATIYLAIGAISTGIAPEATFANFFTNFQRTGANTFTCEATNSQSGTGAVNTNTSSTNLLPIEITNAANYFKIGNIISSSHAFTCNNSAGQKTLASTFNGSSILSTTVTTVTSGIAGETDGLYIVKTDRQIRAPNPPTSHNIASQLKLGAYLIVSSANDFICLERLVIKSKNIRR